MHKGIYDKRHICICLSSYTLSLKSLSGHSSVCYKTSLNTGGVGQAGAAPPTSKLEKFLSWPLALSMLIYSNFQINGTSGEILKPPDPYFASKIGHDKNFPNLEVGGAAPARPTPPVFRLVL